MNFIVSSSALLKQLQHIDGVVSSNTVLPILEDFLFEIEKGKLTIFSTDLEISMSSSLEIESKVEGKIAIPAKMLLNILKVMPDQPLTFSIDERTFGVEIKSASGGRYRLAGENGEDFPRIPVAEDIKDIKLASSVLKNAISACLFAVGTDELRPAMTGVNFELSSQGITFVATDAHKLVRYIRKDTKAAKSTNFIIPRKALMLLNSSLPQDDTQVIISYNSSNAFFSFGNISLICRLIDARYPDYNAVIPTDNPNKLIINRNDILNTVRRLIIFANKTTHQVTFKLSGSELHASARDIEFSNDANESLACNYKGENLEIAFNGKFLIEMLSSTTSEEVLFEFSTPSRAVLVSPVTQNENENLLMLLMPIMIN
jgi:DNA polymerase-3 subunit beta